MTRENNHARKDHHRRHRRHRRGPPHPQRHRDHRDIPRRDDDRARDRGRPHRAAAARVGRGAAWEVRPRPRAGFNVIVPFVERIAYRHSLKEVPLDVPEQVCITKDNTQLAVDGIIYFQVVDPKLASYGSSDYIQAITQLAQTALRS
jgi:hypothetical protein